MTEPERITAPAPRRRGPASTETGQRSRDRVLRAAVELITEAGIDKVRIAEIARRAGMSTGQLMYYFTGKEHILLEALAWQDYQDLERARAALAKTAGAWRQLEVFIGHYLPASSADPSWILWLEAWARASHNREVSKFLEDLLQQWCDELAAIVTRGVQEGVFATPADGDDFTIRFVALLDGLAMRLRQMHQPSRKRFIELALTSARAELASKAAAAG
jgi:AcrR family transcriptional regulator